MKKRRRRIDIGIISIAILMIFLQACSSGGGRAAAGSTTAQSTEPATTAAEQTTGQTTEQASAPPVVETGSANPSEIFAYDSSKPMNVQEVSVKETETGAKIHEISWDAYDASKNPDGKISSYMIEPKGKGPFPAVVYLHWLGSYNANKDEFLDEATALADKGIAGLLIDGCFPWRVTPVELEKDKSMVVYQVIELKRAVDYLTTLPYVDTKRIGYVGHDYGAMFGSVLSGIDKRISSYVLITGMGNFSDWFLGYWVFTDIDGSDKYREGMRELDPVNYIRNAAPAKLFFQFANKDTFVFKEVADEFYGAASQPKEVKFYDGGHDMRSEEARADRQKWLMDNLK